MAEEAARSLTARDEVDVDDMIAEQIREMEKEIQSEYPHHPEASGGADSREHNSMALGNGSLDLSRSVTGLDKKATLRDSLRSSLGLSSGGERADGFNMGDTGLKSLLMTDFRLDASPDNVADVGTYGGGGTGGHCSPSRRHTGGTSLGVGAVNDDMEKLLKLLHDDENFRSGQKGGADIASITQVTDMLASEMNGFVSVMEERGKIVTEGNLKVKTREEELREQGRAEARAKNLFGECHVTAPSESIQDAVETEKDGEIAPRSKVDELAELDVYLGVEGGRREDEDGDRLSEANVNTMLPPRHPMVVPPTTTPMSFAVATGAAAGGSAGKKGEATYPPRPPAQVSISSLDRDGLNRALAAGWTPVQAAVDKEMAAADEILFRMRSLRTGLGTRLRHLDAMHASVMTGDSPAIHPTSNVPREVQTQAPAMLRSSHEHWNGITRVNEPAGPPRPANVGPFLAEDVPSSIADISNAANSIASIGRDIEARLDNTMNGMIRRLTEDHPTSAVATVTCSHSPPASVTPPIPQLPNMCTEKVEERSSSSAHVYGTSLKVAEDKAKMEKARENAGTASATSSPTPEQMQVHTSIEDNDDFGPTIQELNEPMPQKSLLAQIDDIDVTLGKSASVPSASNQPEPAVAARGGSFDQFLPQDLRQSPFGKESFVTQSSVLGVKRKNLSPSPFRTTEMAAPPKLYTVPPLRDIKTVPLALEQDKRRIVAPSDQELLIREVASAGVAGAARDLVASAPPLTAAIPSISSFSPSPSYPSKYPGAPVVFADELPWASQGGAGAILRNRPVEGSALMAQRQESASMRRAVEVQQAQEHREHSATSREYIESVPITSGPMPRSDDAKTAIKDRKKYLKDMQNLRSNLMTHVTI